ncbi:MAG: hypothetical protein LKJ88_04400 [Bacilli bacterium]|nr:hypothetical protein [Bacilli bacterium]
MKHPICDYPKFMPGSGDDDLMDFDYDEKKRTITMLLSIDTIFLNPDIKKALGSKISITGDTYVLITFYDIDIVSRDFKKIIGYLDKIKYFVFFDSVGFSDGCPSFDIDFQGLDWDGPMIIRFHASSFEYKKSKRHKLIKHFDFSKLPHDKEPLVIKTSDIADYKPSGPACYLNAFSFNERKKTMTMVINSTWHDLSEKAFSALGRPEMKGRYIEAKIRYCFHNVEMTSPNSQEVFDAWEKVGWQICYYNILIENGQLTLVFPNPIDEQKVDEISFKSDVFEYGLVE